MIPTIVHVARPLTRPTTAVRTALVFQVVGTVAVSPTDRRAHRGVPGRLRLRGTGARSYGVDLAEELATFRARLLVLYDLRSRKHAWLRDRPKAA